MPGRPVAPGKRGPKPIQLNGGTKCTVTAMAIEPRQEDGTGFAVHIAARAMERAEGGDVLVFRTVMDLTAGSDLEFEAAGRHKLKGVPGEIELFRPT